jgi:hypothetical protein
MPMLRTVMARVRALWRRDAITDEISDEMQFHLDQRADALEHQGFTRAEARRLATRRFGNVARLRDEGYDVRGGGFLETTWQDVRYGTRMFRRQPGFSAITVVTLALGIGVTASLFSVIDATLLRPLPFDKPDQLVDVTVGPPKRIAGPSLADVRLWRTLPMFSGAAIWMPHSSLVVDTGEH